MLRSSTPSTRLDDLMSDVLGDERGDPRGAALPAYEFDSAFQGRAAVEAVQGAVEAGQSFALAFVDMRMPPGWNGVETIRRIWERDPDIQMIICSAYTDYTWEDIVEQLGPTDKLLFLRKPVDPSAVKQMALATTSRWQTDLKVRDRVQRLEHRLAQCEQQLVSRGDAPSSEESMIESLTELRTALSELSATTLTPEQLQLLRRASDMCISLAHVVGQSA
ncbi:response regulator [Paraliomyxa miuraensis]|uniref:response regulator n=1 Tax=Paraliomyxa miuraensis TaxID=376150 RepID=UPI00225BE25D|nr:response regulator [Paraliomyxa miuraensis]MCX4243912.1 response regulator [Paraliomyxa miuraensis]